MLAKPIAVTSAHRYYTHILIVRIPLAKLSCWLSNHNRAKRDCGSFTFMRPALIRLRGAADKYAAFRCCAAVVFCDKQTSSHGMLFYLCYTPASVQLLSTHGSIIDANCWRHVRYTSTRCMRNAAWFLLGQNNCAHPVPAPEFCTLAVNFSQWLYPGFHFWEYKVD